MGEVIHVDFENPEMRAVKVSLNTVNKDPYTDSELDQALCKILTKHKKSMGRLFKSHPELFKQSSWFIDDVS